MKNLYLLALTLSLPLLADAQTVSIPDAAFKARLLGHNSVALNTTGNSFNSTADANGNGEIEMSEAALVTGLRIHTIGNTINDIQSFEGLQYFTNLKSLWCSDNPIGGILDVSMLTQLEFLVCNNTEITELILPASGTLTEISAAGNNLTTFSTSNLLALKNLTLSENNIASLNATLLPQLSMLDISDNPIAQLALSQNAALQALYANSTQLSEIDCSSTIVQQLHCSDNPNLTSINVKNNTYTLSDPDMLYYGFAFDNLPQLTNICIDSGEQSNLVFTNYNSSGNVIVYTGPNCETVVTMGLDDRISSLYSIYPNPSSSLITIDAKNTNIDQVRISNLTGQTIRIISNYQTGTPIDISELASGAYLISIDAEATSTTQKLIKI